MKPLQFTCDFKVKDALGTSVPIIHNARWRDSGDRQQPNRDLEPDSLYAPVARHETIVMLVAKVVTQDFLLEGLEISNPYLYGDLDKAVLMSRHETLLGYTRNPTMSYWWSNSYMATALPVNCGATYCTCAYILGDSSNPPQMPGFTFCEQRKGTSSSQSWSMTSLSRQRAPRSCRTRRSYCQTIYKSSY